jgi:hypothetical protein
MRTEPEFAALPECPLVPSDKAAAERQKQSRQAALRQAAAIRRQRLQWPLQGYAPLPPDALVKKP